MCENLFNHPQIEYTLLKAEDEIGEIGDVSQSQPKSVKVKEFREDIALLRALAILAVLGFHFWPTIFTMGFVGVDVFFVISGYLIMTILERSTGSLPQIFLDFYYRRLKRIFPLYFLVMFLIGFSMIFVYTAVWAQRYFSHYLHGVLFYLNINMLESDGDYFAEAIEDMPFLHSWSLAVEIQFYLLAPAIFYVAKLKIGARNVGSIFLMGSLVSSWIFQYSSTPIVAFYHPIARLWQFLVGMLSAFYSNSNSNKFDTGLEKSVDAIAYILIISVLVIFLPLPHLSPPNFIRTLVTVASGAFLLTSSFGTIDWSIFRLGYLASISYSLYLVHFPVLRFAEYLADVHDVQFRIDFFALLIAVIISAFLHHFYEKPQLAESRLNVFKESLKYFLLSLLIALKWETLMHPEYAHNSALKENAKFTRSMYKLSGGHFIDDAFGRKQGVFGHYRYKNGTGEHKVIVVGNSWATQQSHIARKILPESYTKTMELFSWSGRAVAFHYTEEKTEFFWNYVEKVKPDLVFVLMRYHQNGGDMAPFVAKENDTVYQYYLDAVKRLSKFADHIFIETHQPFDCGQKHDFLNRFMDLLEEGKDMEKAYQPFDAEAFDNSPVQQRLDSLIEECPKCHLLNLAEVFIDRKNKRVITYNSATMLAYYDNGCHLTASGLKKIEKPFRETVEKVLKIQPKSLGSQIL